MLREQMWGWLAIADCTDMHGWGEALKAFSASLPLYVLSDLCESQFLSSLCALGVLCGFYLRILARGDGGEFFNTRADHLGIQKRAEKQRKKSRIKN